MALSLPPIVTGIINGEEEAWSTACTMLGAYYQPEGGPRSAFDLITSGDPYADDTILAGIDIAAMTALGVRLPAATVDRLLADEELAGLIAQIPVLTDLVDADDEMLDESSAAGRTWQYLTSPEGYGLTWKTAEALLTRVRPALFPVITGVERKALGLDKDMPSAWIQLREALRDADARLAYQLYYLIQTAPVWSELSQIQVLMALVYTDALHNRQATDAEVAQAKAEKRARKAAKRQRKLEAAQARQAGKKTAASQPDLPDVDLISTDAFRLRES